MVSRTESGAGAEPRAGAERLGRGFGDGDGESDDEDGLVGDGEDGLVGFNLLILKGSGLNIFAGGRRVCMNISASRFRRFMINSHLCC
jgi:hypothetical protein